MCEQSKAKPETTTDNQFMLRAYVFTTHAALAKARTVASATEAQARNTVTEYMRLLEEHTALQVHDDVSPLPFYRGLLLLPAVYEPNPSASAGAS